MRIDIEVPMSLPTRANWGSKGHWHRAKLVSEQHRAMALWFAQVSKPELPVTVQLVRVSPRELDQDNLRGALKATVDFLAAWLGLPNDRDPRVRWLYGQAKGEKKHQALRVTIVDRQYDCPACGAALLHDPISPCE